MLKYRLGVMYSTQVLSLTTHTGPESATSQQSELHTMATRSILFANEEGKFELLAAFATCDMSSVGPVTGPGGDVAGGDENCRDDSQD